VHDVHIDAARYPPVDSSHEDRLAGSIPVLHEVADNVLKDRHLVHRRVQTLMVLRTGNISPGDALDIVNRGPVILDRISTKQRSPLDNTARRPFDVRASRLPSAEKSWLSGALPLYFQHRRMDQEEMPMRFGVSLPNVGDCGNPHTLVELAREAEEAGWDGVFVWDCIHIEIAERDRLPMADPWIALAAIAMATSQVRIGPIVTPLARRRPWKVARESVSLDHLSHGRLILPVGYGAIDDGAFCKVGEETNAALRAQKVEEGLEILSGLWSGEPFAYRGEHYQTEAMTFLP